ncbi:MAG: hydantoinase/oxoprolinase family protein [Halanaeroarchaeum sp.]
MIIGIDTGGTNVDAALIDADGVVTKAKVPNAETRDSIESVLEDLLETESRDDVERVVVATTLVVNAAVQRRLPDCANVVVPGPGLSPERAFYGDENVVAAGGIDPRGRVIESAALDEPVSGETTAITAKFSARNPLLERDLRDDVEADAVALGSESGAGLTFPERAATTVANAKAKPVFQSYESDVEAAVDAAGIDAPVYYLKGDGSMLGARSMRETPAHTLRGGSAASSLGLVALTDATEAVTVDVGGTTTDVTLVEEGFPSVDSGIPEGDIEPAYEGVVSRSLPYGGDTRVEETDGDPALGAERVGNAVAFGGTEPTVTDALHVLGHFTEGDVGAAEAAMGDLATDARAAAEAVYDTFVDRVSNAIADVATESVDSLAVGGVLAPHIGADLARAAPVAEAVVPEHADVAGAVGCGVARVSVETAVHVDSARGVMTVTAIGPETVEAVEEGRRFTDEQATEIALDRAREAAENAGGDPNAPAEVRSLERFSVVERTEVAGQIFDAEARIVPGIEYRFAEGSR